MALLTKKEFAEKTNQTTKTLATYIGRGKAIVGDNDLLDTENPINKAFIEKNANKQPKQPKPAKQKQIPREETYIEPKDFNVRPASGYDNDGEEDGAGFLDDSDILPYHLSEQKLKHWQALKTEREAELKKLEIAKKNGEVIPSDLIQPLFLQHNQSIITAYKNTTEAILTEYAKIKDMNPEEIADMRGKMVMAINKGAEDATVATLKSIGNIINEYSEKRGAGQRK